MRAARSDHTISMPPDSRPRQVKAGSPDNSVVGVPKAQEAPHVPGSLLSPGAPALEDVDACGTASAKQWHTHHHGHPARPEAARAARPYQTPPARSSSTAAGCRRWSCEQRSSAFDRHRGKPRRRCTPDSRSEQWQLGLYGSWRRVYEVHHPFSCAGRNSCHPVPYDLVYFVHPTY